MLASNPSQHLESENLRRGNPLLTIQTYRIPLYRLRNLVERLWCRLKDWRRVATRYDKLARNYLAGVYLAALLIYWIN